METLSGNFGVDTLRASTRTQGKRESRTAFSPRKKRAVWGDATDCATADLRRSPVHGCARGTQVPCRRSDDRLVDKAGGGLRFGACAGVDCDGGKEKLRSPSHYRGKRDRPALAEYDERAQALHRRQRLLCFSGAHRMSIAQRRDAEFEQFAIDRKRRGSTCRLHGCNAVFERD